jgi:DNA-binding transcriptional regulator LsrR (DeoR family)
MLKVARMSHESHQNNQEIADQLFEEGLLKSRNAKRVQEIIDDAGIWLLQEHERLSALERADATEQRLAVSLCDKFGLHDARVVSSGPTVTPLEYVALLRRFGRVGADYFDELTSAAEDEDEVLRVGIGGGQTALDLVSSLPERKRSNVYFHALSVIGRGRQIKSSHVGPETNVTVAWARSGRLPGRLKYGTVQPYEVPVRWEQEAGRRERHESACASIQEQLNDLCKQDSVHEMLRDMSDHINMAIAGIGIVEPTGTDADYGGGHIERMAMTSLLKTLGIDLGLLTEEGAAGEFSYCLFDKEGKGDPRWRFFLTAGEGTKHAGVEFYRHLVETGRKVIVCAGPRKEYPLRIALKARLLNVLITDAHTANQLLKG